MVFSKKKTPHIYIHARKQTHLKTKTIPPPHTHTHTHTLATGENGRGGGGRTGDRDNSQGLWLSKEKDMKRASKVQLSQIKVDNPPTAHREKH